MPNDPPSADASSAFYHQPQRWLAADCLQTLVAHVDGRTLRSSPESGERTEYDGANARRAEALPRGRYARPHAGAALHASQR